MSVRSRLFWAISCLMGCFILAVWLINTFFLEDFYLWQKKESLKDAARQLPSIIASANPDADLEVLAARLGGGIIIVDENGAMLHNSFGRMLPPKPPGPGGPDKPPGRSFGNTPPFFTVENQEQLDERTLLLTEMDPGLHLRFLILRLTLPDSHTAIVRIPLASVEESAAYATRFTLGIGILCLIGGCLWAFWFARFFTSPLLEISRVAQRMANLDFSATCSFLRNDELGRLGQSINHLSDQLHQAVTELNRENVQLTAAVEKERQLDKMRKNFVSSVSHELKTPLALIQGYAEGLREHVADDEESRQYYCDVIMDETTKMTVLVKDLLNLSQMESGLFQLSMEPFDPAEMIGAVLQKYQPILQEKHITWTFSPVPWSGWGDPFRLEQVLINLLNNAIDHASSPGEIHLTMEPSDKTCRIGIFNTGDPIPEYLQNNIWQSFYKADQARSRQTGRSWGGYGLGLSIVRAIQDLHDAGYGVENRSGGVRFWFDIHKIPEGEKSADRDCHTENDML